MDIAEQKTEQSQNIGAIAGALAKAQSEMAVAAKDAQNPHFKNQYASFESIVLAWKQVGPKNELAISQLPVSTDNGAIGVRTMLMHKSGEYIASTLLLKPVKNDPQGAGSALTYAKRYAFAAIIGMATGEGDDDAEAATGRGNGRRHDPPPRDDRREEPARDARQQTNGDRSHSSGNGNGNANGRAPEEDREEAMKLIADARTVAEIETLKSTIIKLVPNGHPHRKEVVGYMTKRHEALSERRA